MEIIIANYDPETRAVEVTFTEGDIIHTRAVNACHDDAGAYDETATAARVADVARGVEIKIDLGVISKVEPELTPLQAPE